MLPFDPIKGFPMVGMQSCKWDSLGAGTARSKRPFVARPRHRARSRPAAFLGIDSHDVPGSYFLLKVVYHGELPLSPARHRR